MATKDRNTYGNIFKATALFSGVKVFQILISIVRSKLVAMLIGPIGMGINNLLSSTIITVNHFTACGLQTSAVREVAKAHGTGDENKINTTITVLRFFVWITGMLGTLIVFFFSSALSQFAFGSTDYSLAFKCLSVYLIVTQINSGQVALLQGTFHYKYIAKSSIIGQIIGLLITIPIYYFLREKGIVPVLIITAFIPLCINYFFTRKIPFAKVHLPVKEMFKQGKDMMTLGIVLALGGLIGNLSSYIMNIFLSHNASVEEVGLYGAGIAIANQYIFMVLSAMSTDYVPRISALSGNPTEQVKAINKQIELVMLLMLPLLVAMISFAKIAIAILYTEQFYEIAPMLRLFMLGMFFQAITWCLSYAVVARGDKKAFLFTEFYNLVVSISLKIGGFLLWGLVGIGIAFIIDYILEFLLIFIVSKRKFGFAFTKVCFRLICVVFIACVVALALMFSLQGVIQYVIGGILCIFAGVFSLKELNNRMAIFNYLKRRVK